MSAAAIFLAGRLTDDFVLGLGVVVVLAILFDVPWWFHSRFAARTD